MKEILGELTKPWSKKEVKWRVGSVSKNKDKALPLAYIDARTVMERLDAAVGAEFWQDRYEFHGDTVVCYLSIWFGDKWITKADGAGDSAVEKEKGAISDAFKRASVKWGMGRELYAIKCRWMPINEYKQLVGNPWDYVIPNADDDEPEPAVVDEKRKKAEGFVTKFLKDLEITEYNNIPNLEYENEAALQRIKSGYPDLYKAIDTAKAMKSATI